MRVLAVASEVFPLVKTGGLADVTGALPLALAELGVEVRTVVPGYPAVMNAIGEAPVIADWSGLVGGTVRLRSAKHRGLNVIAVQAPSLYEREGGLYGDAAGADHPDNWRRFAVLAQVAARVAGGGLANYRADLVHAHDWQAGLTPAYLRFATKTPPPSMMTIHNLAFQGQFPASVFAELGLPASAWAVDGVEYYGGVGFLKGGLQSADAITTVSPTYAREIATPAFGMGLDGLLRQRAGQVRGILNGIDTLTWSPASDGLLEATYSAASLNRRKANRRVIEERLGLDHDDTPLLAVVSRLTWQKGMDLLAEACAMVPADEFRLAILGSGEKALEERLATFARARPGRIGLKVGYDEALSHLLHGGADAILVPSRFEPCGLTQMSGLRYGCVPIVARTGGLADTVIDANIAALRAGVANGFQFAPATSEALAETLNQAIALFRDRATWSRLQRNGMRADVSWVASARQYLELFSSLVQAKADAA